MTCLRSHSQEAAELGAQPRSRAASCTILGWDPPAPAGTCVKSGHLQGPCTFQGVSAHPSSGGWGGALDITQANPL